MKSFLGVIVSVAACTGVYAQSIQVNYYSDGSCNDYIGTQYIGDTCSGNLWGTQSVLIVCTEALDTCGGVQWSPSDACDYSNAVGALDCSCNDGEPGNQGQCWDITGMGGLYAIMFTQGDPFLP